MMRVRAVARRGRSWLAAAALAAGLLFATAGVAGAEQIWSASGGTGSFEGTECDSPGRLTADGGTFRFQKSVGIYRCEARSAAGVQFREDSTYWLGWEQSVGSNFSDRDGDFVTFQWKSYPNADQNYPLLMRIQGGRMILTHSAFDPGPGEDWSTIWSMPVQANEWHRIALGIHTSSDADQGWVELSVDGRQQTFAGGGTRFTGRTWDSNNKPKWGMYDRGNTAFEIVNTIRALSIGDSPSDLGVAGGDGEPAQDAEPAEDAEPADGDEAGEEITPRDQGEPADDVDAQGLIEGACD